MKKTVVSMVLGLMCLVAFASVVAAQDLTAAYQYQRLSEDEQHRNIPAGFLIEGAFPIGGGGFSAVGQFDWARKSEGGGTLTIFGTGAGVRWAMMTAANPFVELILGNVHHSSGDEDGKETGNNFAVTVDGGVAVPINAKCSVVGQIGYRWLNDDESITFFRFAAGLRINLSN